jgi:hypothetical protein
LGRFEIRFSRHAERQLIERNIKPELVQETLENAEQIVTAGKNRKIAQRTYQRQGRDFLLRVVFSEQGSPEIITMYWTSKVSKYRRKS